MWIGPAALKGCENLSAVSWPSDIDEIQEETFSGCFKLESLDTHVSFRAIGQRAFFRCEKLTNLPLSHVEILGKEAFFGCASLTPQALPALAYCGERAFDKTLFPDVAGHILISGQNLKGEVCIPEGIRSIAPYAFSSNKTITKIILPKSLSFIGEGAFWGCSELETVVFSDSMCRIDRRAFEKCISLKSVKIHTDYIGDRGFSFCTSLMDVELQGLKDLKDLKDRLFEGCRNLRRCVCPLAERIGSFCFSGCESMDYFDFSRIRHIGSYGFWNCDGLTELNLEDGLSLMPHAFEDCGRIEQIVLSGGGDVTVREYAFSGCTSLKKIIWQGETWELKSCRDILSDRLPEMVRLIYHSALSCFQIENNDFLSGYRGQGRIIRIPEGIRRIGGEVFRGIF